MPDTGKNGIEENMSHDFVSKTRYWKNTLGGKSVVKDLPPSAIEVWIRL